MNRMIKGCAKGASIIDTDGHITYEVRHGLTEKEYHPTRRAMVDNYCSVVCDDAKRKTCHILNGNLSF